MPCTLQPQLTTSIVAVDAESPLNPAELQVLRAQYEKEGELVGVQTKFNYAWVSQPSPPNPPHHASPSWPLWRR